jgi:methyl-accepting chemotaxis protein
MIEAIQLETHSAVLAMEEGTRQVKQGVTATNQAGEALHGIIRKSEEVGDMITMIATAATEQSSTTEEVKNSMEQISRLVEASTIGTQQSAKACQDLSGLTNNLRTLVERFHLSREQASGAHRTTPRAGLGSARLEAERSEEAGSIHRSGWVQ